MIRSKIMDIPELYAFFNGTSSLLCGKSSLLEDSVFIETDAAMAPLLVEGGGMK